MDAYMQVILLVLTLPAFFSYKPKLHDAIEATEADKFRRGFPGENAEGCGEGWVKWERSCYKYGDRMLNWDDAQKKCEAAGGHLAWVWSKEENDFLLKLWNYSGTKDEAPWLGATDRAKEGDWRWTDGKSVGFTFWAEIDGEPNGGKEENCLNFSHRSKIGRWNDSPCSLEHSFICERFMFGFKSTEVHE